MEAGDSVHHRGYILSDNASSIHPVTADMRLYAYDATTKTYNPRKFHPLFQQKRTEFTHSYTVDPSKLSLRAQMKQTQWYKPSLQPPPHVIIAVDDVTDSDSEGDPEFEDVRHIREDDPEFEDVRHIREEDRCSIETSTSVTSFVFCSMGENTRFQTGIHKSNPEIIKLPIECVTDPLPLEEKNRSLVKRFSKFAKKKEKSGDSPERRLSFRDRIKNKFRRKSRLSEE